MTLLLDRSNRLFALIVTLAVLSSDLSKVTTALRNQMRTVKKCDTESKFAPSIKDQRSCQLHCEKTYISSGGKTMIVANKNLAQFLLMRSGKPIKDQVKQPEASSLSAAAVAADECCCVFNTRWPDFVHPKAIRKDFWRHKFIGVIDCLPLMVSIRLSKRTRDSYNTICRYLSKTEPLTMAELLQFVEAAAYLNYAKPKHPFIRMTLSLKEVARVDRKALKKFKQVVEEYFYDSLKPLEDFDGHRLDTSRLREFDQVRQYSTGTMLRSPLVAKAFDEYVVSYAMLDVAAARQYIDTVNRQSLKLPKDLLLANYDKYDTDHRDLYFTVDGLECKALRMFRSKLTAYLNHLKRVLSPLYEKLIYEKMAENYHHLVELIQSQKLYTGLMEINCPAK